jgi:hypothetical protein
MSYNIDRWKTKELGDFRIKMHALKFAEDYLEHPMLDLSTGELMFDGRSGGFGLRGKQDGDVLIVSRLENYGEASGTMQEYLIDNVFPHSTGYFHAVLVWEGGDSIERLQVRDGAIEREEIDL